MVGSPKPPRSRITHQSADQPAVRGRDPVVFVYIQLSERTDIYLKLALIRHRLGKLRIQAVDALYDQNIIRVRISGVLIRISACPSGNQIPEAGLPFLPSDPACLC